MKPIPSDILAEFEALLKKKAVPAARHADYRKWLMYYLDFKGKYSLPESRSEHVRLFIEKLQKKVSKRNISHVFIEDDFKKVLNHANTIHWCKSGVANSRL